MNPLVGLLRGFVVDFFNRHDVSRCRELMVDDYRLRVGDAVISGRDDHYVPAVQAQFDQFPGLGMTVHGLVVGEDQVALHFSEHGASGGPGGRSACWSGIALYTSNGTQLSGCVAVEDYAARRRQLTTGGGDPVDPPMAAPWDTAPQSPDPAAEVLVRRWLADSGSVAAHDVVHDDEHVVGAAALGFDVTATEVTDMFSAGPRVAFHVRQLGTAAGATGSTALRTGVMCSAGIVEVIDGRICRGRIIRDRAGLRRSLSPT